MVTVHFAVRWFGWVAKLGRFSEEITFFFLSYCARPKEYRAGNRLTSAALMDHPVPFGATMDQSTQTPFPGSELLDLNPFVRSPIKAEAAPGVGEKRARPNEEVSIP